MMTIAKSRIMALLSEEVDCIYAERTQAKFLSQIKKTVVKMPQRGNDAASNAIKTASARLLEKNVIEVLSREASDNVSLLCFERRSQLDTFKTAVVKWRVSNSLFIRTVAGLIPRNVFSAIQKCRMTQIYAQKGQVEKKRKPPLPSGVPLDAMKKSENTMQRKSFKNRGNKNEKRSSQHSRSPKKTKWSRSSSTTSTSLRRLE